MHYKLTNLHLKAEGQSTYNTIYLAKQRQDKVGSSVLLPEISRCCDATWKLDINKLSSGSHTSSQEPAFHPYEYQAVASPGFWKVFLSSGQARATRETHSCCILLGLNWFRPLVSQAVLSPDSKWAFAALSFQLYTWCKHCWSTTIRICIIFGSFTVSSCLHSEELQSIFTPSVSFLSLFVYFETIKAGNVSLHVCSTFCATDSQALMRLSEKTVFSMGS